MSLLLNTKIHWTQECGEKWQSGRVFLKENTTRRTHHVQIDYFFFLLQKDSNVVLQQFIMATSWTRAVFVHKNLKYTLKKLLDGERVLKFMGPLASERDTTNTM